MTGNNWDDLLIDQQRRWQQGERPLVEAYLLTHPDLGANTDALLDLIGYEVLLRRQRGEEPTLEEYLGRFPHLSSQLRTQFEIGLALDDAGFEAQLDSVFPDGDATSVSGERNGPRRPRVPMLPDYEILDELGQGGMGVVYRARQRSLNRIVAVKLVRAGELASEEEVRRFRLEAENVARLDHPHIVPVYEVGEHDGQHYFSMKLIEGGSLATLRRSLFDKTLLRSVAHLLTRVARAVHHAHQRGILHRDLKPANILLDERGEPHITDFGLARRLEGASDLTQSGAIVGTPNYMAPEQAGGDKAALTTAVDVHALGAILYEMLTDFPPFASPSVVDTLLRVRHDKPTPPRTIRPSIDVDLETICLKCLEKEPTQRYASAAALADDLERYQQGRPIQTRPVGAPVRFWRWCRRNRAVATLAAVLCLMIGTSLGLGAAYLLKVWDDQRQKAALADQKQREAKETRETLEQLQRSSYSNIFFAAFGAFNDMNIDETKKRLNDCDPKLRSIEWFALKRLSQGPRRAIALPSGPMPFDHVAISKNGRVAAAMRGAFDPLELETIVVVDLQTGKFRRGINGPLATDFALNNDGSRLAVLGSGRKQLGVWDTNSGECLWQQDAAEDEPFYSAATFVDGSDILLTVAYRSNKSVFQRWDSSTGKLLATTDRPEGGRVIFSPDGKTFALLTAVDVPFGHPVETLLYDTLTLKPIGTLKGHARRVVTAAFPPESPKAPLGPPPDGTVPGPGDDIFSEPNQPPPGQVPSVGGRRVATAGDDGTVKVWEFTGREWRELCTLAEPSRTIFALAFSPDGQFLLTAGEDRAIRLYDLRDGRPPLVFRGQHEPVQSLAFLPDGSGFISGSEEGFLSWNLMPPGVTLHSFQATNIAAVIFSAQGNRVVAQDVRPPLAKPGPDTLRISDLASGKTLQAIEGEFGRLIVSADGRRIVAEAGHQSAWSNALKQLPLRLFDAESGREMLSLPDITLPAALDATGRLLAGVARDSGKLVVVDTATGKERFRADGPAVITAVVLRADGSQVVAAYRDGTIILWDTAEGKRLREWKAASAASLLALRPDGRQLAAVSEMDRSATVWDVDSGKEQFRLSRHTQPIASLAYSPDGSRLLSGGADRKVKLWDPATGQELLTFADGRFPIHWVGFSADATQLAAVCHDERLPSTFEICLWDARPPDADK